MAISKTIVGLSNQGSMPRMCAAPDDPDPVHQSEPCNHACSKKLTEDRNAGADSAESSSCNAAAPGNGQSSTPSQQHAAAWLNLSHELRTPTHAILGQVELILSGSAGPLSSEMRVSLGDIQHAAIQLSAQISDVIKHAEALSVSDSIPSNQRR